ncbi:hypothetical protein OCF84_21635 (plasmid) [Shewanella xiamenensis]|uniref:Uncharacterized protein n=1 Tax=Shewanella xiamenensis TaxID=332186 RepID=A0ABT6UDH3_9GAMM|nr:hypothetical protein [Shewanella xiamenensis]MDI5832519.1 hypothetical protein [Shewanella xiamenensis]WHF57862.1 hypothetical protein OCF84_21635 [Shewanella xiamenensis]
METVNNVAKGVVLGVVVALALIFTVPSVINYYGEYQLKQHLRNNYPLTLSHEDSLIVVFYLNENNEVMKMPLECNESPQGSLISLISEDPMKFQIDAPYASKNCPSKFFASHKTPDLVDSIFNLTRTR